MDNYSNGANDIKEVEDEVEVDVEEDIEKTRTPKMDDARPYLLYDNMYFEKEKSEQHWYHIEYHIAKALDVHNDRSYIKIKTYFYMVKFNEFWGRLKIYV